MDMCAGFDIRGANAGAHSMFMLSGAAGSCPTSSTASEMNTSVKPDAVVGSINAARNNIQ